MANETDTFFSDLNTFTGNLFSPKTIPIFDLDETNKWTKLLPKIGSQSDKSAYIMAVNNVIRQRNEEEKNILCVPIPLLPMPCHVMSHMLQPVLFMIAKTDEQIRHLWRLVMAFEDALFAAERTMWASCPSIHIPGKEDEQDTRFDMDAHLNAFVDHMILQKGAYDVAMDAITRVNSQMKELCVNSNKFDKEIRATYPNERRSVVLANGVVFPVSCYDIEQQPTKAACSKFAPFRTSPTSHHDLASYGVAKVLNNTNIRFIWKGCRSLHIYKCHTDETPSPTLPEYEKCVQEMMDTLLERQLGPQEEVFFNGEPMLRLVHHCLGTKEGFQKRYMIKPNCLDKDISAQLDKMTYPNRGKDVIVMIPVAFYTMTGLLEMLDRIYVSTNGQGMDVTMKYRLISRVINQPPDEYIILITILDYFCVEKHLFKMFEGNKIAK